jgi:tRNA/tmRNA/rRNA uracil-C5-methylase (TrmA/RlmC/RlmD family)
MTTTHPDTTEATTTTDRGRNQYTTRFIGAKPPQFTRWLIALLGLEPDDHLLDMFPGSGRVSRAAAQGRLL